MRRRWAIALLLSVGLAALSPALACVLAEPVADCCPEGEVAPCHENSPAGAPSESCCLWAPVAASGAVIDAVRSTAHELLDPPAGESDALVSLQRPPADPPFHSPRAHERSAQARGDRAQLTYLITGRLRL